MPTIEGSGAVKFYTKKKKAPSIIIVSLIDILAILLIFFIVTTTFRKNDPRLKINLPESRHAETGSTQEEPIVLNVKDADEMTLDNQPVTMETLSESVKRAMEASPRRSVALRADRDAPFGIVVQVIDALREAGVTNIPAFTQPLPD